MDNRKEKIIKVFRLMYSITSKQEKTKLPKVAYHLWSIIHSLENWKLNEKEIDYMIKDLEV